MQHKLKVYRRFYKEILLGTKTYEIRSTEDRQFSFGDTVELSEVDDDETYTGRRCLCSITHITDFNQKPLYVVFSIRIIKSWDENIDKSDEYPKLMRLDSK